MEGQNSHEKIMLNPGSRIGTYRHCGRNYDCQTVTHLRLLNRFCSDYPTVRYGQSISVKSP